MNADEKNNLLGVLVNGVDRETASSMIICAAKQRRPYAVSALAVHGVMEGVLDPAQLYRLNHLELVVADGQPVRWALNLLHSVGLKQRVYCPSLMIAGVEPSTFTRINPAMAAQIANRVRQSGAQIVFVGLGCPRQEVWAYEFHDRLAMPIVAVGAAFPFLAGTLRQAPQWMQDRGLEWLFRLCMEPQRLWRRYLLLSPAYLFLVACQLMGFHFHSDGNPPDGEILYG
jgi:UDP-N-acetyl-D-mannosaminuronic acid transferase (WecB/TagA/CpsF family)